MKVYYIDKLVVSDDRFEDIITAYLVKYHQEVFGKGFGKDVIYYRRFYSLAFLMKTTAPFVSLTFK